jgi:hypothetical protein
MPTTVGSERLGPATDFGGREAVERGVDDFDRRTCVLRGGSERCRDDGMVASA